MSVIGNLFARLFAREPAYHESAYGPVYSAVISRLSRQGVKVGGTAGYPRVEVHSITEGERQDKEGCVRLFTMTVESIGNASLKATRQMNDDNLRLLTSELVLPEGWKCFGVIPGQLQDMTESSDSAKIIYRLLQQVDIWVERVKAEPEPEVIEIDPGLEEPDPDDPGGNEEPGDGPAEPDDPNPEDPDQPIEQEPFVPEDPPVEEPGGNEVEEVEE